MGLRNRPQGADLPRLTHCPEKLEVRDHGRDCEHGRLWPYWEEMRKAKWWQETERLGGRRMILRRRDDGARVEVDPTEG